MNDGIISALNEPKKHLRYSSNMAITDFEIWLDSIALNGYEDVYSLYSSVNSVSAMGRFSTQALDEKGERWIVSASDTTEMLLLASIEAKNAFLLLVEGSHCGDMEMEGWYYYNHAKEKDD